jgi:hypothetical protein
LADISLAQFVSRWYKKQDGTYAQRVRHKIIRYRNYDKTDTDNFKREMVTLHVPFFNEEIDIIDCNKYLQIYDAKFNYILEARKEFESDVDLLKTILYCTELCDKDYDKDDYNITNTEENDITRCIGKKNN